MATKNNLPQSDSSNNSPAGDKISRRLLLQNSAAALGLLALSKSSTTNVLNPHNAPAALAEAHQVDADPALLVAFQPDSQEWQLFNDLLAPILEFRAYVIEGEKPLDPRRLLELHDEAQNNSYDLSVAMSTRDFERNVLMACCDEVEYEAALSAMYPELDARPEPVTQPEPAPALSREFWLQQAARFQRLAAQAMAAAEVTA